jgi:hypothetical protein
MIVSPEQSMSGHTEIIVSTGTTIITLDALDRIDQVDLAGYDRMIQANISAFVQRPIFAHHIIAEWTLPSPHHSYEYPLGGVC